MADDKKAKKDDKPKDDKLKADKSAKPDKKGVEENEAAAGAEGAENAEEAATSTRKKIILFIVLPLLMIIALGAGAYFTGLLDRFQSPKQPTSCENVKEGDKNFAACSALQSDKDAGPPGVFMDIPPMIVNLNSNTRQPRFLKISLKVEVANADEEKKLEAVLPVVVDQFQMYLRELRIEDLRGTSGIYRMKIELLSRVRAAAPNTNIRDVLFQEILVQ